MRLLLIEDDELIGKSIREGLRREGYSVDWVRDGWAGERSLGQEPYDLLVLDLGIPRKDGLTLLTDIRRSGNALPVLVVTARDAIHDRVKGLDCGADDYLVKPFSTAELSARIRALLRRGTGRTETVLRAGELELDPLAHEVRLRGKGVMLSQREFALLEHLMRRPGAVVSKSRLEQSIYGWGEEVESNTVEVHISNLRKKLGPTAITTVRGVGYRIEAR